ncbi:dihydrolipoamide acetyltransferase component of pyruvate dehydrogenase complex [Actinoplanes cyaneus]|uniref:Dihydrolipoamide acetyltransferase component of pyruvate dehydrogenase complex n=1 Tax=Actinoplanes cyaneus TaxID=52696 RepID=A0A919IHG3_9ACTN|nr:dihydrolipoamide acetyltransferase family protein [Actinoplanes cyaneus]MCW2142399.1 pyruvate dehydrogenase E2 component (dihydrolipoamide acetyltransferase) [Actinoplanes cyaneus]GID65206.1 dihydrolipoamide acetyltransferase component of pyruvate dehydrogenase complex [Actinoplanes cyaneus]
MIFRLPDLGEGLTEAEIVRWMVAEGDVVAVDQSIAEVETAKSMVEVPSPYAGKVAVLHAKAGETLAVGEPLITVEDLAAETYREEEQAGSGSVLVGYGTSTTVSSRRHRRPRVPVRPATHVRPARVVSPLVRNLARSNGVDLEKVTPTGRGGVIVRADVERAMAALAVQPAGIAPAGVAPGDIASAGVASAGAGSRAAALAPAGLAAPASPPLSAAGERRVALNGFGKAAAAALTRSRAEIPEATVWVDVDATKLWELRESTPDGPGLLAYLARFTVAALREFPVLNARFDAAAQEIVTVDAVNLGIAVQGDRGLMAPAVLGAEKMTTTTLGENIRRLTAAAREGRVSAEELSAGTFTLNNYGSLGVDGSAAIINHPQVAILGFGRILDRPWVVDGQLCVRKITQMSFVFDHRVCDGAVAAGFMRRVADAIENPASAIAHL